MGLGGDVIENPEEVLPIVIMNELPIGITGLLVAGLIAAAMSTFDSIVNAGAAYWVKDIYQRYLNPEANGRQLLLHSRGSSLLIIIIGVLLTYTYDDLNEVWGWITMSLGSGLIVPQLIRWYWWRFNGYGFAFGTFAGMVMAVLQRIIMPESPEYVNFLLISSVTFIVCIMTTFMTEQTGFSDLKKFYANTRPFGFWGPVRSIFSPEQMEEINKENRRDIISIFIAVPWQLTLFITPMVFMTKQWDYFFIMLAILIGLSVALYFTWFRHLSDIDREEPVPANDPDVEIIGGREKS